MTPKMADSKRRLAVSLIINKRNKPSRIVYMFNCSTVRRATALLHLDTIMTIVEQLTATNAAQDWINAVIDHVVRADRWQT